MISSFGHCKNSVWLSLAVLPQTLQKTPKDPYAVLYSLTLPLHHPILQRPKELHQWKETWWMSYDATSDSVRRRIARLLLKAVHVERHSVFRVRLHIAGCVSRDPVPEARSLHNAIKQFGQRKPRLAWPKQKKMWTLNTATKKNQRKWIRIRVQITPVPMWANS